MKRARQASRCCPTWSLPPTSTRTRSPTAVTVRAPSMGPARCVVAPSPETNRHTVAYLRRLMIQHVRVPGRAPVPRPGAAHRCPTLCRAILHARVAWGGRRVQGGVIARRAEAEAAAAAVSFEITWIVVPPCCGRLWRLLVAVIRQVCNRFGSAAASKASGSERERERARAHAVCV